jgi:hypothetical protein
VRTLIGWWWIQYKKIFFVKLVKFKWLQQDIMDTNWNHPNIKRIDQMSNKTLLVFSPLPNGWIYYIITGRGHANEIVKLSKINSLRLNSIPLLYYVNKKYVRILELYVITNPILCEFTSLIFTELYDVNLFNWTRTRNKMEHTMNKQVSVTAQIIHFTSRVNWRRWLSFCAILT